MSTSAAAVIFTEAWCIAIDTAVVATVIFTEVWSATVQTTAG